MFVESVRFEKGCVSFTPSLVQNSIMSVLVGVYEFVRVWNKFGGKIEM